MGLSVRDDKKQTIWLNVETSHDNCEAVMGLEYIGLCLGKKKNTAFFCSL